MRLYWKYFAMQVKSQMQYKLSFFLLITGQFLGAFGAYLSVYFMMIRFGTVGGYSMEEVLLCFATVLMAFSLAETFFRGFDRAPVLLGNGEFDRMLVRPRSLVLQVLGAKIELNRLGRFVQAVLVLAYAMPASGVVWTGRTICTLILMILGGAVVFSGLFMVYAGLCFFTTEALEVMNIFTDGGREFGRYPVAVYGGPILKFFTFVIPVAWFQQYPLLYLLGRETAWLYRLSPLVCVLFLVPCYLVWRAGLRHYKSTGS